MTDQGNQTDILGFIQGHWLQWMSVIGALSLFTSICYHAAFFYAIELDLLSIFDLTDYIVSGIPFVFPFLMYLLIVNSYFIKVHTSEKSKARSEQKKIEFDRFIRAASKSQIQGHIRKLIRNRRLLVFAIFLIQVLSLILIWTIFVYDDFSWLVYMSPLPIFGTIIFILVNELKLPTMAYAAINILLFVMVMILTTGAAQGRSTLQKAENSLITYVEGDRVVKKKIYLIRNLSNWIICISEGTVMTLTKSSVTSIVYTDDRVGIPVGLRRLDNEVREKFGYKPMTYTNSNHYIAPYK